jgi:hypothetical protein
MSAGAKTRNVEHGRTRSKRPFGESDAGPASSRKIAEERLVERDLWRRLRRVCKGGGWRTLLAKREANICVPTSARHTV